DGQPVASRDFDDRVHVGGLAEDVDGKDGLQAPAVAAGENACGVGEALGIDGQGPGLDVDEDRPRAHVEGRVGGGDEAEGRGDDEVVLAHTGREHAEVQPGRAAAHAGSVTGANVGRNPALEELEPRADAQGRASQVLIDD